jgi:hypothetical protein
MAASSSLISCCSTVDASSESQSSTLRDISKESPYTSEELSIISSFDSSNFTISSGTFRAAAPKHPAYFSEWTDDSNDESNCTTNSTATRMPMLHDFHRALRPLARPPPGLPPPGPARFSPQRSSSTCPDALLFCMDTKTAPMRTEASRVRESASSVVHFPTTASFINWLFIQPRGDIIPWATLVAGWREAKPCAMAILAARSGDTSRLRPDARRPGLRGLTSPHCEVVLAAVDTIIVCAPPGRTELPYWAEDDGMECLDISVVSDVNELATKLTTLQRRIRL